VIQGVCWRPSGDARGRLVKVRLYSLAGSLMLIYLQTRYFSWRARQGSNLRPSLFVARPAQGQGATGRDTGRQNGASISNWAFLEGQGRTGRDTGLWYRCGTKGERHFGIPSFSET
jgi:hypothetical protein